MLIMYFFFIISNNTFVECYLSSFDNNQIFIKIINVITFRFIIYLLYIPHTTFGIQLIM